MSQTAMDSRSTPRPKVELSYAGFVTRLISYIIDGIFLGLVSSVAGLSIGILGNLENLEILNIIVTISGIVTPFYYIGFWAMAGATPGKIMLGMRIVGANGRIDGIGFGRAILRFIGYFISSFFFYLGFIWIAIDDERRGWHDRIAGTHVIQI
jgi:uncharacterized RDD family membrane protein YckC